MTFPRMIRLRQRFARPVVADVPAEVRRQLARLPWAEKVRPGQTVCLTAGSRGIANIDVILKAAVDFAKERGAVPFLVPAMGSHGGATAEGQLEVLREYGITPGRMGCEIRSSMETVVVDRTPQGIPVHFDKHAFAADHVLVVNRVKPHTGFVGEIESGLHKMLLIGLGKHAGALVYHQAIVNYSFAEIIGAVSAAVLRECRIFGGLGIVENAYDETALLEAVLPENFYPAETRLLAQARDWLPRLPFPDVDLLIVDRIGKNFSGTGMDTNVIGRKFNDHAATERDSARCRRIYVRGLTDETKGNASGIGLAEFTNTRTVSSIDLEKTRVNCITASHPTGAMIPIAFDSDRDSIAAALLTIGLTPPAEARVVQIANTLHLGEVLVSEAYEPLLAGRPDLDILSPPRPMLFDEHGNLPDVGAGTSH